MSLSKLVSLVYKYPVIPSMLTFGLLFPAANVVQQTFFKKHKTERGIVDWGEVKRFSLYGAFFHGPLVHNWITLISRLLPGTTVPHVMIKVLLDQICFAPVILSTFLIVLTAMEGKTSQELYQQWKDKFVSTWSTGACVWPILTAINYRIVPLRFRTTYIGVCSFFWFIFLAHLKSRDVPWKSPLLRLFE